MRSGWLQAEVNMRRGLGTLLLLRESDKTALRDRPALDLLVYVYLFSERK
jgi:hypothetical protein